MNRRIVASLLAVSLVTPTAALAQPALPHGMNLNEVRAFLDAPIEVPAGEATTVEVGVPVSMHYVGEGWTVTSQGTTVTVVAPADHGATTQVPASAMGYGATITLVAQGDAAPLPVAVVPAVPEVVAQPEQEGAAEDVTVESAEVPTEESAAPTVAAEQPAATPEVEHVRIAATVEGNTLNATLGFLELASLLKKFASVDREGLWMRNVESAGREITGVATDIEEAARSITVTYPEGQTPDNPFIIEVLREDALLAVVTLVDENIPVAVAESEAEDEPVTVQAETSDAPGTGVIGAGIAVILALAGAAFGAFRLLRRRA